MTTKAINKKASSTAIITIISIVVVASGAVTGTLVARHYMRNRVVYISYQDAIDIATAIPDVADFIDNNDIQSVSADREYNPNYQAEIWTVEFYASGRDVNYTDELSSWADYAFVEIEAITGEVLYYTINNPTEPIMTEQQVLQIAYAIPEISTWLATQETYYGFATYDNEQYWYVTIYGNSSICYSEAHAKIRDTDGEVISWDLDNPISEAIHTPEEIYDIVEDLPEVQSWISRHPSYERHIQFYITHYSNDTIRNSDPQTKSPTNSSDGGIWYVDYWTTENSTDFWWINIHVADLTGEVIQIQQSQEPEFNETQVLAIALEVPEIVDFLENRSDYSVDIWYNSNPAYWTVRFTNNNNTNEYAFVKIHDPSGDIVEVYVYTEVPPNITEAEAIAIALDHEYVQYFLSNITDYNIYTSYSNGKWYVDIIDANNGSWQPGQTVGCTVEIDGFTGEVLGVYWMTIAYCTKGQQTNTATFTTA